MEIRFCDDCGKRITEPELLREPAAGERQLCGVCLANARALQAPITAPISSTKNTAVLSKRSTAQMRPARQTERIGSGLTPATKTPFVSPGVAVAISGGIIVGIIGFFALTGSNKEPHNTEKTVAKADVPAVRQPIQPVAVVSAPAPATPAQAESPTKAAPLPGVMRTTESQPAGAAHELSPKEEYDLRVKRGEIKPAPLPTPAPPDNPTAVKDIPASTEDWKDVFNGKDLTGFHIVNGNWKVEDGALTSVATGDRSRIQTDAQYGDFEMKFKLMLAVGRHAELQLREYNQIYPIQPDNGGWKEVAVKAFGMTTSAAIDGVAVSMEADSENKAANGVIGIYAPKGVVVKLKEIKVRPIRKP